jgi:CubicO group peptidase (beta-lactamase class C family)
MNKIVNVRFIAILVALCGWYGCNNDNASKGCEQFATKWHRFNLKAIQKTVKNKLMAEQLNTLFADPARQFSGQVLVAMEGKILFEGYYGYADKEKNIPMSDTTGVHIASLSKPFTGMAILKLHELKLLSIQDPITKYFPEFPYQDIRIESLLKHRSGLPNYAYFADSLWRDSTSLMSNEQMFKLLCSRKPQLSHAPNAHFCYSNTNYVILAMIVEQVTKMKYEHFLRCAIFEPFGLKNTFIHNPKEKLELPSNGSLNYWSKWIAFKMQFTDGTYGDKNIYSTVRDLYRWDRALREKNAFLNDSTLQKAYTPYSNERPGVKNYGLGWRLLVYPQQVVVYHNGWWHGNNATFYRFQKADVTIIILGNKYTRTVYNIHPILAIINDSNLPYEADSE